MEAWDPRIQKRVGKFEIAPQRDNLMVGADTSVSCLKFKDHLHLAAGTGWGQVCLASYCLVLALRSFVRLGLFIRHSVERADYCQRSQLRSPNQIDRLLRGS